MADDIIPCRSTNDLENKKFAENSNDKVVIRVEDEEAVSVLNDILAQLGGASGSAFFDEVSTTTTPGSTQVLLSGTVPVSTTRTISRVVVICRKSAKFEIKINSSVVGSGRTGPANMNVSFDFNPARSASAGDTISIELTQIGGASVDVEAYLMATDT